ncbi:5-formyltetrahydrofolate cyclo-ligase [Verrucomicrobia bacterium]|jgi:5-formyltetrahydrofolate cyclo-ligase|nr:5-formyltetrahydrofolate cyclo-ligase [Verrucomicrobiota bacterium]
MAPTTDLLIAERKRALRRELRATLQELLPEQLELASKAIVKKIQRSRRYLEASTIAFYWAVDWELDLSLLFTSEMSAGKSFALPRWNSRHDDYEFAELSSISQIVKGPYGIHEPALECRVLDHQLIDLVLVPGLAFSRAGARLGRGRGYYDRLLEPLRSVFCGVCHDIQLMDNVPSNHWDRSMHCIVTPSQSIDSALV